MQTAAKPPDVPTATKASEGNNVAVPHYLCQQAETECRNWVVAPSDVENLEHVIALAVCGLELVLGHGTSTSTTAAVAPRGILVETTL